MRYFINKIVLRNVDRYIVTLALDFASTTDQNIKISYLLSGQHIGKATDECQGGVMRNFLSITVLFFLVLTLAMKGVAMTVFSGKEENLVLFSPLAGKLTFQGKPAAGAKIVRTINWKDETGEAETFFANEKGEFSIPIKTEAAKLNGLSQFVAYQTVEVIFHETEFTIWRFGKMGKKLNDELGGRAVNLTCELTDDFVRVEVPDGGLGTSCKWDSIEKN